MDITFPKKREAREKEEVKERTKERRKKKEKNKLGEDLVTAPFGLPPAV